MRILILDTHYSNFLHQIYSNNNELENCPYSYQWRFVMDQCFGTSDFYSDNLQKLGCEAHEIIANCMPLQRQWTKEFAPYLWITFPFFQRLGWISVWRSSVLREQVKWFKPDVLLIQDMNFIDSGFIKWAKSKDQKIIGQHASLINDNLPFGDYDLILSSLPNVVDFFRLHNVQSEYFRLGFEPKVLKKLSYIQDSWSVVHVGGYGPIHDERNMILEIVAREVPIDFWGYGLENLSIDSPIRERYHGEAWGLDMYQIRFNSKIVITSHITSVADKYANNMSLYEVTGVGACLLTDMKDNLSELFTPDIEVATYRSSDECVEKLRYLLENEHERAKVAKAGQLRTLRNHTFHNRMEELLAIFDKYK